MYQTYFTAFLYKSSKDLKKASMIYYSKYILFPSSDAAVGVGEEAQPSQKEEKMQERTQEARFKLTYTSGKGGACSHIRLQESVSISAVLLRRHHHLSSPHKSMQASQS